MPQPTAGSGTTTAVEAVTDSPDGYAVFSDGRLAVERDVTSSDPPSLADHAATVENTNTGSQGDVLASRQ